MEPKKSKVPILNKPKTMKLIIILIIIIVVIGGVTMKKRRGVKIVFRLNKKQYTLGEPVYIHFIIHNHSKKGVDFDLGFDAKGNFKFIVRDIEGRLLSLIHI